MSASSGKPSIWLTVATGIRQAKSWARSGSEVASSWSRSRLTTPRTRSSYSPTACGVKCGWTARRIRRWSGGSVITMLPGPNVSG